MQNVFQIATKEGLLVVPLPSEHNSILEKTTRHIFACFIWHCGLGKYTATMYYDLYILRKFKGC